MGNFKFNKLLKNLVTRNSVENTLHLHTWLLHWLYIRPENIFHHIWSTTLDYSTFSRQSSTYLRCNHSSRLSVQWDLKPVFKLATANPFNNRSQIWLHQQWDIKVLQPLPSGSGDKTYRSITSSLHLSKVTLAFFHTNGHQMHQMWHYSNLQQGPANKRKIYFSYLISVKRVQIGLLAWTDVKLK